MRNKIALQLGYKSWDDYQTEIKMAKTGAGAKSYIDNLISGTQPKFAAEISEMQKMKAAETNDPKAKIEVWDWRYYQNQLNKQKYNVDKEALRNFFPFQKVLDGMFAIYQNIFGLKFEKITAPYKWVDDLQLYMVSDSSTGEPLGMFYLDMFPRDGKFNHFAQFNIIDGKLLPDGKYQRPTVALLCNFPPPSTDKPSLDDAHRRRNVVSRVRSRAAFHRHARKIPALCRLECSRRFRGSAFANVAELGLGQNRPRYFRSRLS